MSYLADLVNETLDTAEDPEQDAIDLVIALRSRFGWGMQLATREDADNFLQSQLEDDTARLTDDEWADVSYRLELDDDESMATFWDNIEWAVTTALPDTRLNPAA